MQPAFVIAGKLNREYILPSSGPPLLDSPGGSLLYAAGGFAVWERNAGLAGRVNEEYPRQWLRGVEERGFDIRGVRVLPELAEADLRFFAAFDKSGKRSLSGAVSQFASRQLSFPKSLLGYQPSDEGRKDPRAAEPLSPSALDVPKEYRAAPFVLLCPFDLVSQSQMVNLFRAGSNQVVCLDPSPGYMSRLFWRELRALLQGVSVFLPSEEELRSLFWGETNDLWEMARRVTEYGPQAVAVKCGPQGQLFYDARSGRRQRIPAYPSRVADPTGAGDAFGGGFLAGLKQGGDPLTAALYGNISASLGVEGSGPFYPLDVLPGLAEARLRWLKETIREF
jgi:ribokinase